MSKHTNKGLKNGAGKQSDQTRGQYEHDAKRGNGQFGGAGEAPLKQQMGQQTTGKTSRKGDQ